MLMSLKAARLWSVIAVALVLAGAVSAAGSGARSPIGGFVQAGFALSPAL